ncbi:MULTISPECIES: hypothetical protein [Clostridium]|uniref:hypothetical protein n=1 Tax=Clostridium TaxID=1485 RepID=UPI0008A6F24D|nr:MULTISPECIES: hypothetical protein [Clostridium]AOY53870.1 hypothetical protein FORC25_1455 [Clostridium perfringens]MDK0666934.1 hypothetical protein [Clostridium perfringens]MDK0856964.1 hypothetical protein [Clostridium perfringens]MDM0730202.1 hypothetical protein [Clostridium perfringens]MDU4427662.1 hypothetical protein [Clostridium sp.]
MARELGIRKVTFFPSTGDNQYGSPIPLEWAVNLETKNNYKEKEYKGDMKIERSTKVLESVDITLGVSSNLPPKVESQITGAEYSHCMKITKTSTIPVSGALAYEIVMDDSTVRRRCLKYCSLAKDEQKNDVDSEGEVFTFSGKAISDSLDNVDILMDQKEVEAASGDSEAKAAWDNFFTKVPTANQG